MALSFADAIAQLEGTNNIYNNPGAISGTGDTGSSFGAGIGIYSTPEAGDAALDAQVNSILSGSSPYYPSTMTIQDAGTVYSGGNPSYGTNLANLMGVSPTTTLGQLSNPAVSPTTSSASSNGIFSGILGGLSSATGVTIPGQSNTGLLTQIETWITSHAESAVVVVVGLILIAAGVFSFKSTQTVIQTVGNVAKKGAELAS